VPGRTVTEVPQQERQALTRLRHVAVEQQVGEQ
jgi:hypothetical protein